MPPKQSASQIEDNFAKDILNLQTKWLKLSYDQRLTELQKVVAKYLKASGFSQKIVPTVQPKNLSPGIAASYDSKSNTILVNNSLFVMDKKSLTNAETNQLAADVRHEIEHAKDAKKVANLFANELAEGQYANETGDGKALLTAQNIEIVSTAKVMVNYPNGTSEVVSQKVSPIVAAEAVKDYNLGVRLKLDSPERVEAEKLREAGFTSSGLQQIIVGNNNLNQAASAYEAAVKAHNEKPLRVGAEKVEADIKLHQAIAAYQAVIKAHDENPIEVAAERVEADMQQRIENIRSRTKENSSNSNENNILSDRAYEPINQGRDVLNINTNVLAANTVETPTTSDLQNKLKELIDKAAGGISPDSLTQMSTVINNLQLAKIPLNLIELAVNNFYEGKGFNPTQANEATSAAFEKAQQQPQPQEKRIDTGLSR
jgi:hypothetical protein